MPKPISEMSLDDVRDTFGDVIADKEGEFREKFNVRTFETGATRSPLGSKLQYSKFMDSRVIKRYCEYLNHHRVQTDGKVREPDNWKSGIPVTSYVDSMQRHYMDIWLWHQEYTVEMSEDIETALCALLFNVQGLLFEVLRDECSDYKG